MQIFVSKISNFCCKILKYSTAHKAKMVLKKYLSCYAFVRVCLYVPCGHLLGKG